MVQANRLWPAQALLDIDDKGGTCLLFSRVLAAFLIPVCHA